MDELTISQVLEHYGADLRRVRERGWCPIKCPFHDDRVASGSVNQALNAFTCHACGMRGDAIALIKRQEGMSFRDAAEWAERTFGTRIERVREPARKGRQRDDWHDQLFA